MLLTENEYNCALDEFLKSLSCVMHNDTINTVWMTSKNKLSQADAAYLWLCVFTLDHYVYGATDNYITESQLLAIFSKANIIL